MRLSTANHRALFQHSVATLQFEGQLQLVTLLRHKNERIPTHMELLRLRGVNGLPDKLYLKQPSLLLNGKAIY